MKEYLNRIMKTAGELAQQVVTRGKNIRSRKEEKTPEVKDVVLQTYFTSLLSLVLCVGMFLGTSYAWFTSEVTNTTNEIYIGNLDVELEKKNSDKWDSLSATKDGANTTRLFSGDIRWEPGYTATETIRVTNTGNLAFKYVLNFTDGTVEAPEGTKTENARSLKDVAQYFDVWVYDHAQPATSAQTEEEQKPAAYGDITAEDSGWEYVGTLDQVLGGKVVLDDEMDVPSAAALANNEDTGHTYTVALHMKDEADASVMGYKIVLSVKLVAYQKAGENDAFGNGSYDANISAVTDSETLKNALAASNANVLLAADVKIDKAEQRLTMNGGILDGYNQTISYTVEKAHAEDPSLGVVTITSGTVRNLTIEGGDAGRALYSEKLTGDLLVSGCTLDGAYAFNLSSAEKTEFSMRFVNTTFKSWTSYANVMKSAEFAQCTFEATLRPYGDTTLTGCTFTNESLDVSKLENGETVTLENCTYNGVAVEKAVVKVVENNLQLECESGVITVSDGKIVLSSNS